MTRLTTTAPRAPMVVTRRARVLESAIVQATTATLTAVMVTGSAITQNPMKRRIAMRDSSHLDNRRRHADPDGRHGRPGLIHRAAATSEGTAWPARVTARG